MSGGEADAWLALAGTLALSQPETHPPAMCLEKCPCPRHALLALIAAVRAGLAPHARAERPTRCYDLDLRCPGHALVRSPLAVTSAGAVMDCPDCAYRERFYCAACREDEWPCEPVRDITKALLGETSG